MSLPEIIIFFLFNIYLHKKYIYWSISVNITTLIYLVTKAIVPVQIYKLLMITELYVQ